MRKTITLEWPIMSGSVSTAKSQCGKNGCACKKRTPQLHGTYYRWTGFIGGKRTTKTITKEIALECKKRIGNLRKLQKEIDGLVTMSLLNPPWVSTVSDRKRRYK